MNEKFGILKFDDFTDFERNYTDALLKAFREMDVKDPNCLATLGQSKPQPVGDWPEITECIRRGSLFCLTAGRHGISIELRFDPSSLSGGSYQFRGKRIESGRVLKVVQLADRMPFDDRFSMLDRFPYRYKVITAANNRSSSRMLWRVGISTFRDVKPDGSSSWM